MLEDIIWLIIFHQVSDFVLQSEYISANKAKHAYHLFVHASLYVAPFLLWFGPLSWRHFVIWGSHLIVDAAKARYNLITFYQDQAIHYALLAVFLI